MDNQEIVVTIDDNTGVIGCLYTENIDLAAMGSLNVRRASYVKFDNAVQKWTVTLVDGTNLGYFKTRKAAIRAEVKYLNRLILKEKIEEVFK